MIKKKLKHCHNRRFLFRLALALGRTVAELEASLSAIEMEEWEAFYAAEPWGCAVEDARWAQLFTLYFSSKSRPGTAVPTWFDRDPEETARLLAEARAAMSLDDKILSAFGSRIVEVEPIEFVEAAVEAETVITSEPVPARPKRKRKKAPVEPEASVEAEAVPRPVIEPKPKRSRKRTPRPK